MAPRIWHSHSCELSCPTTTLDCGLAVVKPNVGRSSLRSLLTSRLGGQPMLDLAEVADVPGVAHLTYRVMKTHRAQCPTRL
jgi:hypothetical protein